MSDLDFIKAFSKITLTNACKILKVNLNNILNGRASRETTKKLRDYLENEMLSLYAKKKVFDDESRKDKI